jgi:hypothetical protein
MSLIRQSRGRTHTVEVHLAAGREPAYTPGPLPISQPFSGNAGNGPGLLKKGRLRAHASSDT